MGPRGKRGKKGPQGARGLTGAIGRRGKIGKPGQRGPKGVTGPLHKDDVLDRVMTHFDDVYRQLNIQTKRIAQIQYQVDTLIALNANK
jgi:collagen triple helix repeat protein